MTEMISDPAGSPFVETEIRNVFGRAVRLDDGKTIDALLKRMFTVSVDETGQSSVVFHANGVPGTNGEVALGVNQKSMLVQVQAIAEKARLALEAVQPIIPAPDEEAIASLRLMIALELDELTAQYADPLKPNPARLSMIKKTMHKDVTNLGKHLGLSTVAEVVSVADDIQLSHFTILRDSADLLFHLIGKTTGEDVSITACADEIDHALAFAAEALSDVLARAGSDVASQTIKPQRKKSISGSQLVTWADRTIKTGAALVRNAGADGAKKLNGELTTLGQYFAATQGIDTGALQQHLNNAAAIAGSTSNNRRRTRRS